VFEEIPYGTLPSSSMLELASQVAHVDVHSDVVEKLNPNSREDEVVPWSPNATTTLSSSVAHEIVHSFSVELVSSTSGREDSLIHQRVAHDDVQYSSPLGPLISGSISVESEFLSEMERVDRNELMTCCHYVIFM